MLLDCRMPEMDGFQVMERLGRSPSDQMVVLMLTSDDLKLTDARARKLNLGAYLVKPVRKRDLLQAIGLALDARCAGKNPSREPRVTTPLRPPAVTPPKAPRWSIGAQPALKILVVDDSIDNRLLVKAYLKQTPYQLAMVENGKIALERFMLERFDLVLMDIQMPVMDGHEAMKLIREYKAREAKPSTPIIALTASAFGEDIEQCLESGATAHIAKPVRKAVLLEAIRQYTGFTPDVARPATASEASAPATLSEPVL